MTPKPCFLPLPDHCRSHERPVALGPPRPEVTVLVVAVSGELRVLDPPESSCGLPYPRPRDEAIRFRAEVMEPGEDFDRTGFELSAARAEDPAQPELFGDDFSQPHADDEPVFWPAGAAQAFPPVVGVQPDAPE